MFTFNKEETQDPTVVLITDIRLLIPDVHEEDAFFDDADILRFYRMEGYSIKRAAALALETIARDMVLVLQAIRVLDLNTNAPTTQSALNASAQLLRSQSYDSDEEIEGSVDTVPFNDSPFGNWRRRC